MDLAREVQEKVTVGDMWLSAFMSGIDQKHFKDQFKRQIIRLMDEYRRDGDHGIYNTSEKLIAKRSFAHLNEQAEPGEVYDPAATEKLRKGYGNYHQIMDVLDKRIRDNFERKMVFESVPLFSFLMRDFLTKESERIIRDDPVTVALKLAFDPAEAASRLDGKGFLDAAKGIRYIRNRMLASVTTELVKWCHKVLPAEAEKCGLQKDAEKRQSEDRVSFELATSLGELDSEDIDVANISDLAQLKVVIEEAESLLDDGQVFSGKSRMDPCLLYVTEDGKYYQQHLGQMFYYGSAEGSILLEDKDEINSILNTGVSPIMLTKAEMVQCGLAE